MRLITFLKWFFGMYAAALAVPFAYIAYNMLGSSDGQVVGYGIVFMAVIFVWSLYFAVPILVIGVIALLLLRDNADR